MTKPSFRVPEEAAEELDSYGERSDIIKTSLDRILPVMEEGRIEPDENALKTGYSGETATLSFRDDDAYNERVESAAEQYGVSKSAVMRTAVQEYLKNPDSYWDAATEAAGTEFVDPFPGYMEEFGILNPATLTYLRDGVVEAHVPEEAREELVYVLDMKIQHFRENPEKKFSSRSQLDLLDHSIAKFGYGHPLPYENLANVYGDHHVQDLEEEFRGVAAYLDGQD